IGAGCKLRIPILDSHLVPCANSGGVRPRQIGMSAGVECDPGMRVIHDRSAGGNGAGGKVMRKSQRVSHLMGGELTKPREHHLLQLRWNAALPVWRQQRLSDEVVLACAQRAQRYLPFDDLTGARIDDPDSI